ncbi:unnamed protein product (macronuclear) [Paramecium tetraurelia]|uniref:Uncharacterized protein n=1 Tax=Paramecium tetraurelia TaxID=5888 RepID=A0D7A4_PARTE|nr:uncharacterized protein GSPATT00001963001 [Paramecium tetraurelia]CAK78921.1 unnamed protein product [Paramecium tetraurelia]|eukprot:XP_001446318.1 hypothetical protein (macronuclear) [Paramecium tetraurelia strain d4-2]
MADDFIKINNEKQSEEQNETSEINQQDQKEEVQVEKDKNNNPEVENPKEKEFVLDLWETIVQGNFDIVYSYEGIIDYNSFSQQGFAIVHYLATQGQLDGLKLMKQRGANLDLMTQTKQNALAIACNFGYIDIAKYLIDQGCSIDNRNLSNMSPLTYAIKNKKYALIFYLLTKGQFQNIQDSSGNSFVHYSAIENDVFMLQFYHAFQLEYNLFDKQGQTPLTKAINSCAIDSIKFLLRENPKLIEYAIDLDVVKSNERIKQLIKYAKIQKMLESSQNYQKIIIFIQTYQKYILIVSLVLFIFFELILFIISEVQKTLNDGFLGLMFDIGFIIGMLYLIFYVVWFMLKTTDNQNQGTKLIQKRMPELSSQNREASEVNVVIKEEEQKQIEIKPIQQKETLRYQRFQADEYMPLAGVMNAGQMQEENGNEEEEEENEDINNNQEEEGLNEKQQFLKKFQKDSRLKFNLYQNDMTPSFLEGITLKDFLQLNYKPVEDLIDQMHTKPSYYFKFANKINQFKQEINSLLEINDPLWYNGFTIIHIVYFLFETNRFKLLHRIDWNRICFTCLSYKLPRTYHCSSCNMCVIYLSLDLGQRLSLPFQIFWQMHQFNQPFFLFSICSFIYNLD